MELSDIVHPDMTDRALLDTSIPVVASVSAVIVLSLAVFTCICCDRKRSGRFSSRSDSHRDTVPLDDLLSKPSLADPESVFSEAGSCEFPRSAGVDSWFGMSGEVSGVVHESVSSNEKVENTSVVTELDKNTQTQSSTPAVNKLEISSQKHARPDGAAQRQEHGPQHISSSQPKPTVSSQVIQPTVQCDHHGDNLVHEVTRNVKTNGSPQLYSHKDLSGKVGLDSTALKLHRDSVTRETVPFLSSARCSFSHEVGHIVHGNKVPRTSLPTTEEVKNSHSSSSSSAPDSEDECKSETVELSVQVETEQASMSWSSKRCAQSGGQHSGGQQSGGQQSGGQQSGGQQSGGQQSGGQQSGGQQSGGQQSGGQQSGGQQSGGQQSGGQQSGGQQSGVQQPGGQQSGVQVDGHVKTMVNCSSLAPEHETTVRHISSENNDSHPSSQNRQAPHLGQPVLKSNIHEDSAMPNSPVSRSKFNNVTNTDRLAGDPEQCQPTRVSMRRCLSYIHGDDVTSEPSIKSRRKTFSLNLKIDVHFDNEKGSQEDLPTVVCCPLTDHSKTHQTVVCGQLTDHSKTHQTVVCGQLTDHSKTHQTASLDYISSHKCNDTRVDGDGSDKDKVLTISLAKKSQNTGSIPGIKPQTVTGPSVITEPSVIAGQPSIARPAITTEPPVITGPPVLTKPPVITGPPVLTKPPVMARKRHSEPSILERRGQTMDNVRQFSRFSQTELPTKTVSDIISGLLGAGIQHTHDTFLAERTMAEEKPADTAKDGARNPFLTSSCDSDNTAYEIECAKTAEVTTDPQCLDLEGETDKQKGSPSVNKTLQLAIAEADKLKVISGRNVNIGSIVINITGDNINKSCDSRNHFDKYGKANHDENAEDRNNTEYTKCVKENGTGGYLTSDMQGDISNEEEETYSSKELMSANKNKTKSNNDKTADLETHTGVFSCQPDDHNTDPSTLTDNDGDIASTETRNNGQTVLHLELCQAYPRSGRNVPQKAEELSDNSSMNDVSGRKEIPPVSEPVTAANGTKNRPYICAANSSHKRSQTVKDRFDKSAAEDSETVDNRFQRSSSLKVQSLDKRFQDPSLNSRSKQGHRRALFFHDMQNPAISTCPVAKENIPHQHADANNSTGTYTDTDTKHDTSPMEEAKVRGELEYTAGSARCQLSQNMESSDMHTFTEQHVRQDLPECDLHQHERHRSVPDEAHGYVNRSATYSVSDKDGTSEISDNERRIYTSGMIAENKERTSLTEARESSDTETCHISDDSDYDNPWDDLDDAVKRASIRYNRRPSRIAAGDSKTLLLKSAEDLGRLLEEADKRRHLRHAINSCQVVSPESGTESMTIPFTRFSPFRHTVKDMVTQSHLNTSHSSEDILKPQTATIPKLSLLRLDENPGSNRINVRRPMSLTSKVKAKITSPETKKRKK